MRKLKILGWGGFLVFIAVLFLASATYGFTTLRAFGDISNYALLAQGLLNGELSLNAMPSPELLALPNPYEMQARDQISYLWDVSLFNGRYFIYFGIVPALLLYVPSQQLFNHPLRDEVAIAILTLGVVVALYLTWREVARKLLGVRPFGSPFIWFLYACFGTGFSLQLGGGMYVVAALSGVLFQVLTVLSLIKLLTSDRPARTFAFLTGLAAVAAIGSRPTHCLIALFAGVAILMWRLRERSPSGVIRSLVPFSIPLIIGGSALGVYNYLRFGSFTEFGLTYQLGIVNLTQCKLCGLSNVLKEPGLLLVQAWYLLFQPLYFTAQAPYLSFKHYPANLLAPESYHYVGADPVTGLVWVATLLVPGGLAAAIYCRGMPPLGRLILGMCAACGLTQLAYIHTCAFAAGRYLFEVISVGSIVAVPSLWFVIAHEQRPRVLRAWKVITVLGSVIGIVIGIVGAIDGHFEKFASLRRMVGG